MARGSPGRSRTVVIAPDSFKGSLDAPAVADALADGWRLARPADELIPLPMADGGEGTLDAVQAAVAGAIRNVVPGVQGPDGQPVDAAWLALPDDTALVELATASGLPLMTTLDALGASTRGLGQVIAAALAAGSRRLLLTLGGSATSDGGTGALRELGLELLTADNGPAADGGGALADVVRLDGDGLRPPPPGGVEILTDVSNPLLGPRGAAAVFGPQKGADEIAIERLEAGLARLASLAGGEPDAAGAGAAGGAGYGFATFWGAILRSGSQVIGELIGLPAAVDRADLVLTGEGAFDRTSTDGKVVGHVLELAAARAVPVAIVAGVTRADADAAWRTVALSDLADGPANSLEEPVRWLVEAGRVLAGHVGELQGG